MKIYQKIQKLNPGLTIPLLLASLLFVSCSTTVDVGISLPASTGVRLVEICPTTAITQETASAGQSAVVTWDEPTATDSNDVEIPASGITITDASENPVASGATFPLGDTTVTYTFTDDADNIATCSFTVTVYPPSTSVTISACPADFSRETAVAETTVAVSWTEPTAQDSNGNLITPVASHNLDDSFPLGPTTVTYTFTDDAGNADTCTFTVTVYPASTSVTISACPADFSRETAVAETTVAVSWTEPTAKDSNLNAIPASGITITITDANTNALASNDPFPLGPTTVTYTFTDTANNTETCTFTVTVSQPASTGVIISGCPDEITQTSANLAAMWTEPTAQDSNNNPALLLSRSHESGSSGSSFSAGSTTPVTYIFADASTPANTATCTFEVTLTAYHFYLADDGANPAAANPFLIETSAELASLASVVNDETSYTPSGGTASLYAAAAYRLENSLDLSTGSGYTHTPIGDCKEDTSDAGNLPCGDSDDLTFTGTFDGNGQTLRGLSYTGKHTALGLFSVINGATISDLTLMDPAITNTTTNIYHSTGALVGASTSSVISNVSVTGGTIQGNSYVGGLVGAVSSGSITASSATGTVSGMSQVGGLVGQQFSGSIITASYATGTVSGTGSSVGGLVGQLPNGSITASYATGAVSGEYWIGGLVGFISFDDKTTIRASYATGDVTGDRGVGGLVGAAFSGTITASYWDTQTTGQTTSPGTGATGYLTAELQILGGPGTIYETWTPSPWVFMAGAYPTLRP